MHDLIFQAIYRSEHILGLLAAAWFLGALCRELLGREGSREKRLWLAPAAYFAVMLFLYLVPTVFRSFTAHLLGVLAAFLVLTFVCRAGGFQSLFLCATFFSLRWQEMSVTSRGSIVAFDAVALFLNWATKGRFALSWQWNMVHIGVNAVLNLLMEALGFLFLARCLKGKFPWKGRLLSRMEQLFLLTPGLFGSVCFFVFQWIIARYDMSDGTGVFQEYPHFSGMMMGINMLMLLSTWVVFSLFAELEQKKEEETRLAVQQSQMCELRDHIRKMDQLYSGVQGMKHDLKNHIAVLKELIEKGQFQEAEDYLEPMARTAQSLDFAHKTGNPVTDVIIEEKYRRAAALGVSFASAFHFPACGGIDVFDISVILNNALENALEAAAETEHGWIKISSSWQKKFFLLEAANSFQGELETDPDSGLPKTTKTGEGFHGIGLKNIRRVAERYCGALDVEVQGNVFILTVMLQEQ